MHLAPQHVSVVRRPRLRSCLVIRSNDRPVACRHTTLLASLQQLLHAPCISFPRHDGAAAHCSLPQPSPFEICAAELDLSDSAAARAATALFPAPTTPTSLHPPSWLVRVGRDDEEGNRIKRAIPNTIQTTRAARQGQARRPQDRKPNKDERQHRQLQAPGGQGKFPSSSQTINPPRKNQPSFR